MAANRWFMETRSLPSVMILCKSIRIETCRAGLMLAKFGGGVRELECRFSFCNESDFAYNLRSALLYSNHSLASR